MVQAFENPTENPNNGRAVPKNAPKIAAPSPIDGPDLEGNMGQPSGCRKRADRDQHIVGGRFRTVGDTDKVNQFCRI
jgi:hypothetical protein